MRQAGLDDLTMLDVANSDVDDISTTLEHRRQVGSETLYARCGAAH